jgi:hypothetical protein
MLAKLFYKRLRFFSDLAKIDFDEVVSFFVTLRGVVLTKAENLISCVRSSLPWVTPKILKAVGNQNGGILRWTLKPGNEAFDAG